MIAPQRTLTTIGLSIRDELRVKSLLQIVEGKTAAPWTYVEEVRADLALCEPDSALARVIMEQSTRNGSPRCVTLLRQGAECPPDIACVLSPLGVREFIALLDGATEPHSADDKPRLPAAPPNGILLEHLRRIAADKDSRTHHIAAGTASLWVMPKQSVVLSNEALTPERVAALTGGRDFEIAVFSGAEPNIAQSHVHRCPLPILLWNCEMALDDAAPSGLPKNASFSLTRWPDFGRLAHHPWHFRLTALMVREALSAQRLSVLSGQPLPKVEKFLHACDSIGILVTNLSSESRDSASPAPQTASRAEKPGRWFSIFQSFRHALNMGSGRD